MQSDPERALPILDRLLKGNSSPRVKDHAIFVLAQSPSPRARQTLVDIAKGQYNPDLQIRALRALGMTGKDGAATLSSIYAATTDAHIKSEILKGFLMSGATDQLYNIARTEKHPELRREAIRQLSMSGGHDQLWQLYSAEPSVEIREEILRSLFMTGHPERIMEVAKTEREPRLRRAAVRSLGLMGPGKSDGLVSMYSTEQDPEVRKEILNALFLSQNAKGLIELARKEPDPAKKQEIVQKLALVRSKESTDYMLELLK
jgi:HEAT repeat protein